MLVLGFSGGINLVDEDEFDMGEGRGHDSAAVLIDDGKIIAGIEQERLDRIKHSNKFPIDAIRLCMDSHGVGAGEVDAFVYYTTRQTMALRIRMNYLQRNLLRQRPTSSPENSRHE